jgi:hypothetical protein
LVVKLNTLVLRWSKFGVCMKTSRMIVGSFV